MARRTRLNPPTPTGNSWQTWATQLNEYLLRQTDSEIVPEPVLLEHQVTRDAKATVDGILMFDPLLAAPVYSAGGAWVSMDGAASYAHSRIEAQVVTDTYVAMTFTTPPVGLTPGMYQVSLEMRVTGGTGGAHMQFRVDADGVQTESQDVPVGNHETVYVPLSMVVHIGGGSINKLEVRGAGVDIEGGYASIIRIGA